MAGDRRKQSLYFPEGVLQEIEREAARQDRSLSWILQQAWRIARDRITGMRGANDPVRPEAEAERPGDGAAA